MTTINSQVFREYDIRGVVEQDFPDEVVLQLGKAVGTYLQQQGNQKMALGRDCRLHSEQLHDLLLQGLLSTGMEIIDLGVVPTPLVYFSLFHLDLQAAVQITGSHNPPQYNGFKICSGKSTIFGAEIKKIEQIARDGNFCQGKGSLKLAEIIEIYQQRVLELIEKPDKSLSIVLDAGNGTGGLVAAPLFRQMGHQVEELFCQMDGTFPNHFPDPTVEDNLAALKKKVRDMGADVGIAYDGDADRIGVIDDQGQVIWGDTLMLLFSKEILARKPGATMIGEVKCSQVMYDQVEKLGGKAIMWRTGHSLIKSKMKEVKAELAGEMSGHIFFADRYYGFDDAIYSSARLLEILAATDRPLSDLLADFPSLFSTPEIRMECPEEEKFILVEKVKESFKAERETIDIDGVRVLFEQGWALVRPSNTQPLLVLRFEAETKKVLKQIQRIMEDKIAFCRANLSNGNNE